MTATQYDWDTLRTLGGDAYDAGVLLRECPYPRGSRDARVWRHDWREASAYARSPRVDYPEIPF